MTKLFLTTASFLMITSKLASSRAVLPYAGVTEIDDEEAKGCTTEIQEDVTCSDELATGDEETDEEVVSLN